MSLRSFDVASLSSLILTPFRILSSMSSNAVFPRKWVGKCAAALHAALSFVVFLFFDLLDAILCVFYDFLDESLEGKSCSCYCKARLVGEDDLSETLFLRRNVFREMGFPRFLGKFKLSWKIGGFRGFRGKPLFSGKNRASVNRWSDCGCESCVSCTENDEENLHVVVKHSSLSRETEDSGENWKENVIFIHGFMGSSYFWTEPVFKHISKDQYRLFAVDLLGFGRSPKPRERLYTLRDHVETIQRSVIQRYRLTSFHVVAHSMGCIIALSLAANNSKIVKSVTLVAPPYVPSSPDGSSLVALNILAGKKLWPPVAFGSAVMSWYEHVGRCVCFLVCKHHKTWERFFKLVTFKREVPWKINDITKHTHHSAWHSMHNVICGGSKFSDKHLQALINSGVKICALQGDRDRIVPLHCSGDMKMKFPAVEVEMVAGADHASLIIERGDEFAKKLESIWRSFK